MERIISISIFLILTVNLFAQGFIPFSTIDVKKHINGINEKTCYSLPEDDGWVAEYFKPDSCYNTFRMRLESKDTTYQITFLVSINEDYRIVSCVKGYEYENCIYLLDIENCKDTSYFCKFPKGEKNKKFYFIGKYQDMYKQFTNGQRYFYHKYKDSLMYVKGNILPPLPEIDLVEDDYTMNFYILLEKDFYYPKLHDKKVDYCDEANW